MTTPASDLGRLKIDREAPARAPRRTRFVWAAAAAAILLLAVGLWLVRRAGAPTIAVARATLVGGAGAEGAAGGSTGGVANGDVVARTQAAVSGELPGRVSEGSHVHAGEIIARLENAEYQAAVGQADAALASDQATLIQARADRDQLAREARRAHDVRAANPQLISDQDVELADSKATQAAAAAEAQQARVRAAGAALAVARANLENTVIRAPFTGTVLRKEQLSERFEVSRTPIRLGDRAGVVGCGVIGLLTIPAARAAGCGTVVATDVDPTRLERAVGLRCSRAASCVQRSPPVEKRYETPRDRLFGRVSDPGIGPGGMRTILAQHAGRLDARRACPGGATPAGWA